MHVQLLFLISSYVRPVKSSQNRNTDTKRERGWTNWKPRALTVSVVWNCTAIALWPVLFSQEALIHYTLDVFSSLGLDHGQGWSICPSLTASPHNCLFLQLRDGMACNGGKVKEVERWNVFGLTEVKCRHIRLSLHHSLFLSSTFVVFIRVRHVFVSQ